MEGTQNKHRAKDVKLPACQRWRYLYLIISCKRITAFTTGGRKLPPSPPAEEDYRLHHRRKKHLCSLQCQPNYCIKFFIFQLHYLKFISWKLVKVFAKCIWLHYLAQHWPSGMMVTGVAHDQGTRSNVRLSQMRVLMHGLILMQEWGNCLQIAGESK